MYNQTSFGYTTYFTDHPTSNTDTIKLINTQFAVKNTSKYAHYTAHLKFTASLRPLITIPSSSWSLFSDAVDLARVGHQARKIQLMAKFNRVTTQDDFDIYVLLGAKNFNVF